MNTIDRLFATGKVYKVGSPEYEALMAKWSRETNAAELEVAAESYYENEDMHGRLRGAK
jgi:hypothetical protein